MQSGSKDPDAYLQCMVNQHLSGKSDQYDFAIIATGESDLTEIDTENLPSKPFMRGPQNSPSLWLRLLKL